MKSIQTKKPPAWPKCPACSMELTAKAVDGPSCGVKNYIMCDVIDILHGRAKPRDH
jgi:hypothetical protein